MRMSSRFGVAIASALLGLANGCGGGSSDNEPADAAREMPAETPDLPPVSPADGANRDLLGPDKGQPSGMDAASASDAPADAGPVDAVEPGLDGAPPRFDAAVGDGSGSDAGATQDGAAIDSAIAGSADGAPPRADGPADAAADGFVPGPAIAVVVNSSNTATYSLADGTWKLFYFDATAGQLYCISDLAGVARGYVGTSPSVSPSDYQYVTNTQGTLAFRAANTQRHYVAVAASGGSASGSFQVADGGQLLALGPNTVNLPAPNLDDYYFFRFPITAGHAYSVSVAGTASASVGLGLSPRAERASNGQFSVPLGGVSGPLPISNENIPESSVALSYSGYYFIFLRVYSATNATITITQTS